MGREIKFRAKDKFDGQWMYGLIQHISPENILGIEYKTKEEPEIEYGLTEVDPATVGQYTGLKDGKRTEEYPEGQEIYESDLVSDCEGGIFNVEFSDGKFTANYFEGDKWEHLIDAINECEIVGNKFEGVIK